MGSRQDIQFISEGLKCAGWFFKAPGMDKSPCVILAHGFCGVKEMRLDAYAEAFAEAPTIFLLSVFPAISSSMSAGTSMCTSPRISNRQQAIKFAF